MDIITLTEVENTDVNRLTNRIRKLPFVVICNQVKVFGKVKQYASHVAVFKSTVCMYEVCILVATMHMQQIQIHMLHSLQMALNCTETTKFHSPWILSSFNIKGNAQQDSIDSLDKAEAERCTSAATESVWCENSVGSQYYDSIDTALTSNVYQQNGEDLAEFDSLERHFSNVS